MKQENRCTYQIRVLSGFSQIPKICWILVCEILSPKISKQILLLFCVWLSISLNAQVINSQSLESVERNKRNTSFNIEEIKVRWKKAALENCPGIPCVIAPSFTCGTTTVSDIDGNTYNTVAIGTQCWTKENLRVTKYNDGSVIGDSTNSTWGTAIIGARTENKGNSDLPSSPSVSGYVGTLGYLYNWYAATDSRKLCPDGWHVPTDAEWTIMIQALVPSQVVDGTIFGAQSLTAGTVMKSDVTNLTAGTGLGWNPSSPGTNTSGFSGLPGGYRQSGGSFNGIRNDAFFWSATENIINTAWYRYLFNSNGNVSRNHITKSVGASVRCLKNSIN